MAAVRRARNHLSGLAVGKTVNVVWNGANAVGTKAAVTELRPLGTFATWQAERVIGDHDRDTPHLQLDPQGNPTTLEPGMTVRIEEEYRIVAVVGRDNFLLRSSGRPAGTFCLGAGERIAYQTRIFRLSLSALSQFLRSPSFRVSHRRLR